MSKGDNKSGLYVDTRFLRDHVSKLREEKKLAARLRENVLAMKAASDPTTSYRYDPIIRDVEQLLEYFRKMTDVLADVDDMAVQLSNDLGMLISEDEEKTRRVISSTLLL